MATRRPGYVEITCCDSSSFREWSDTDLWTVVDALGAAKARVEAGTLTKTKFHELETATGLNCNPHGLLVDPDLRPHLRPANILTWDWVHCVLQDGTLTTELELLLGAATPFEVSKELIREFLKDPLWHFPSSSKAKLKQLHRVFDDHRLSDDPDRVKCNCSELLGLYGLLRLFLSSVLVTLRSFVLRCRRGWRLAASWTCWFKPNGVWWMLVWSQGSSKQHSASISGCT